MIPALVTWRTLFLDVRSGLFFPPLVVWDPQTGEFKCVEGPKGFPTWQEADEAGRFLRSDGDEWSSRHPAPAGRGDVRNDARPLLTTTIGLAADRREARQGGRRTSVL